MVDGQQCSMRRSLKRCEGTTLWPIDAVWQWGQEPPGGEIAKLETPRRRRSRSYSQSGGLDIFGPSSGCVVRTGQLDEMDWSMAVASVKSGSCSLRLNRRKQARGVSCNCPSPSC